MKVFIVAELPANLRAIIEDACAKAGVAVPAEIVVDDGRDETAPPFAVESFKLLAESIAPIPKIALSKANPEPFYRGLPKYRRRYR